MITVTYFHSPVGELILGVYKEHLCLCDWRYRKRRSQVDQRIQQGLQEAYVSGASPVLEQAKRELQEYFNRERQEFTLPLLPVGTPFQKKVWQRLQEIPFGETITYGDLARSLGQEKGVRAVASANGANGISLLIPCHRVVGQGGSLTGYAGGLRAKEKLLLLEGAFQESSQQELFE